MRNRELKKMLSPTQRLTAGQRQELLRVLSGPGEADQVVAVLQSGAPVCPHCQGERVVRNGQASGLQRYKCRTCNKTFKLAHWYPAGTTALQGQVGAAGASAA